jgi:hypothetical protein
LYLEAVSRSVILEEPRGSGATKNLVVGRAFQLGERPLPRFFVPRYRDSRMTVYVRLAPEGTCVYIPQ